MTDTEPDRRLNAYRADLADQRLKGIVSADRFVQGSVRRISQPVLDLLRKPEPSSQIDAQLLFGDDITVFEEKDGYAWVQTSADGYVGYANADAFEEIESEPTHIVDAPRTFVYPRAELRSPIEFALSMGSRVSVCGYETLRGTNYALLENGLAIIAGHLRVIDDNSADFVAEAEKLIHTPYLWGGDSAFGIDCSGLIKLAFKMCGRSVLRDSDMQEETIGEVFQPGKEWQNLQRGDLVFWKGHVGIMCDQETLLHANGHTMSVAKEPLSEAISRISYLYGEPTTVRRPG